MQSMSENDFECFASTGVKTRDNVSEIDIGEINIIRDLGVTTQ